MPQCPGCHVSGAIFITGTIPPTCVRSTRNMSRRWIAAMWRAISLLWRTRAAAGARGLFPPRRATPHTASPGLTMRLGLALKSLSSCTRGACSRHRGGRRWTVRSSPSHPSSGNRRAAGTTSPTPWPGSIQRHEPPRNWPGRWWVCKAERLALTWCSGRRRSNAHSQATDAISA